MRVAGLTLLLLLASVTPGAAQQLTRWEALAREVLREMVEINTTHSAGGTTTLAQAARARLLAAGFAEGDVLLLEPAPGYGNLVARLRGRDRSLRPLVLLAHIDVVEVDPEVWETPPFELVESDGYFRGRGTADNKDEASIHLVNLIRLREEGFRPERDIVVALTAGEETDLHNGVEWLLEHRRELIEGWLVLNEGGGGALDGAGNRVANTVQLAEKVYQGFTFRVTDPGGHSARPRPGNAIARLGGALARLGEHRFPVELTPLTRAYLERAAPQFEPDVGAAVRALLADPGDRGADSLVWQREPALNAALRTTCVPTLVRGGHAANALPQSAEATVNCRLLPHAEAREVQRLLQVLAGPGVQVEADAYSRSTPASELDPAVFGVIERVTSEMWPGVPVVPVLGTGATDGSRLRAEGIRVYGVSGLFHGDTNNHGANERMPVRSYYEGLEFLYRLTRELSTLPGPPS